MGRISGTVTDGTGAVIPGVTVTIANEATKLERKVTADENGFYVATALPVGVYTVSVEQEGFQKSVKTGHNLVADTALRAQGIASQALRTAPTSMW